MKFLLAERASQVRERSVFETALWLKAVPMAFQHLQARPVRRKQGANKAPTQSQTLSWSGAGK